MKRRIASLHHVTAAYFDTPVLRDVTLEFHTGEAVGVVGRNGAGKSSLLRCLMGDLVPDEGTVILEKGLKVGYLPQESALDPAATVWDVMQDALPELRATERALAAVEDSLGESEIYGNPDRLAAQLARQEELLEQYAALGGPSFTNTVTATLRQVGLDDSQHALRISALSGGQKKLLTLARLLVSRPNLLLLDEPDNHLDIRGKQLVERVLGSFEGGVVIVSHDRYLLDLIVDRIIEMERNRATGWVGNYSEYVVLKEIAVATQQRRFQAQQKELRRLEESVARLMHWGSVFDNPKFITRAQSMQKRLDRIERIEDPVVDTGTMGLHLGHRRSSDRVLDIQGLGQYFERTDHLLFADLNLLIWRGERVGLMGPNGAGKSVLLNMIRGRLEPTEGRIALGPNVTLGFYDQEHRNLDYDLTLIETVRHFHAMTESTVVSFLRTFQFDYRLCQEKVGTLSGGQRSRLQMALLMLAKPSFLLLDEPTNNLDIESAEVLEQALQDFDGAMLIVSHDRLFLERMVDRIVILEEGTLREHRGALEDYLRAEAGR